ncbi:hypothetical protein AUR64_02275 [Haloprofundus marisrubri]|uniref:Uncharacterized protein n=1 Tax=Haloprofundus marisrubri TaxID=1514971 RepID=A0A0W1R396_9EURY|nr:hypothetical protein AUR64_02275 [Haloprofundus marisrubri]
MATHYTAYHTYLSQFLKHTSRTVASAGVLLAITSTTVAAQEGVGNGICGTPLADTINQAAPLVVGTLMIGAAILSYVLHTAAGFPKDPQTVQSFKNWRNRAGISAVTTPLFAVVIEMFIGFTGTSLADCVSLVPFF